MAQRKANSHTVSAIAVVVAMISRRCRAFLSGALLTAGVTVLFQATESQAEPYLAVRSGLACSACHTNPSGGGQRTTFGNVYAQNVLSVKPMSETLLDPSIGAEGQLRLGGNARYGASYSTLDGIDDNLEFSTDRVSLYGSLQLNKHLLLYVDQQVAPGGSINRESWVQINKDAWFLKAGKLFLPYGWRLEDDSAFIRRATGINFTSPENGLELGYNGASVQVQLSISNGSGGVGERDDGKFFTFRGNWLSKLGQLGVSAGHNDGDFVDRTLLGVFAGVNTGPVTWLLEYDYVEDEDVSGGNTEQNLVLVEANWLIVRGHNLKLTVEHQRTQDQDRESDRASAIWEFFPWAHTQLRTGIRVRDSKDPIFAEGEEYFVQAHIYF